MTEEIPGAAGPGVAAEARTATDPGRAGDARWVSGAILLLALALRLPLLTSGLPYMSYVDEGHVLHPVLHLFRHHTWDPDEYLYPTLAIYLIALAIQLARPFYHLVQGHSLLEGIPQVVVYYDIVSPAALLLVGRMVITGASLAIVWVGMGIARRIGGRRCGWTAGLLLAVCPSLLQRSGIVIVDTIAALMVLLTLYAALRLDDRIRRRGAQAPRARREAMVAGGLAGLATMAKYPAGAVFLAVLLAILPSLTDWRPRLRLALLATVSGTLAAFAVMPALWVHPGAVLHTLRTQVQNYGDPARFGSRPGPRLLAEALLPEELGPLLLAAGLLGVLFLVRRPATRRMAWGWIGFGALMLLPLVTEAFQPFRNALPLVPPLLIGAAFLVSAQGPLIRHPRFALALAALLLASQLPGVRLVYGLRPAGDTRIMAVDLLARKDQADQRILVQEELAILPAELDRVRGKVHVASWRKLPSRIERGTCDLVLFGRFDLGAAPQGDWVSDVAEWEAWMDGLPVVADFGSLPTPVETTLWRSNDERILVARCAAARASRDRP